MKSQARILLDKMNCCQLNIKQKQKPSTQFKLMVLRYHWSLAINKLQKIIIKRCQQPLLNLQEESVRMKKSRSQQPSLLFTNKRFEHLRYHSQYTQSLSESKSEEDISTKMQEKLESTQKDCNINEKILQIGEPQILKIQNEIKQSAYFHTQSSLDSLKFNEEFLDLFKKQKEVCHFGYLSQDKLKEQEILIKKILDSRPSKPIPDIKTFLSLIKKPQVEIEQSKPKQYYQLRKQNIIIYIKLQQEYIQENQSLFYTYYIQQLEYLYQF